jgi:uncharacterized membrane protein YsdA (DUF1294 family)
MSSQWFSAEQMGAVRYNRRMATRRRRNRPGRWWSDPVRRYPLITFGIALLLAAVLIGLRLDILPAWLISITAITFLTYGYDKQVANAGSAWMRVPELNLLALALTGGTLGALAGMALFRHKTIKAEFRARFWLIAGAQGVVLAIILLSRTL